MGRKEQGRDAVDGEGGDGPAEDVECGGGERGVGERDAEGELVGRGGCGGGDVVELGGEDGAEDAVELGTDGVDCGDDDGQAGGGLLGEVGAKPMGAGGEFGGFVGSRGEGKAWCRRCGDGFGDFGAGGADGFEEGMLGGSFGIEADEEEGGGDGEVCDGGADGFGELGVGEVVAAGGAAVEVGGPAGEGSGVGVAGVGSEMWEAAVLVEQEPGFGGGLGEGVEVDGVGCEDGAPEGELLGVVEQEVGGVALEDELVPKAGEPGVPGEDGGRGPEGVAEGALVEVEGVVEGAGGSLVGGEDGCALRQGCGDLPGQGRGLVHTPFIRLGSAEKRAGGATQSDLRIGRVSGFDEWIR